MKIFMYLFLIILFFLFSCSSEETRRIEYINTIEKKLRIKLTDSIVIINENDEWDGSYSFELKYFNDLIDKEFENIRFSNSHMDDSTKFYFSLRKKNQHECITIDTSKNTIFYGIGYR